MTFHEYDPDQQRVQLSLQAVQNVDLEGFSAKLILEPTSYNSGDTVNLEKDIR